MSARSRLLLLACLSVGCLALGGCALSEPGEPVAEAYSVKPPPPYIAVAGVGSSDAGGPVLYLSVTARGDYVFVDKSPGGDASTIFLTLHMADETAEDGGMIVSKVHSLTVEDLTSLNDKELEEHVMDLTGTVGDISKVVYVEYYCKFWVVSETEPDGWTQCEYKH